MAKNIGSQELHEGRVKPLRGFTPRHRLNAPDPLLRSVGHATEAIRLAGSNTNPVTDIAGQAYNLGGFAQGVFEVSWDGGRQYARFQTGYDGDGDPTVKVMDADRSDAGTVVLTTADAAVSADLPSAIGGEDAICFGLNADDELVLHNDIDADSGADPGPVVEFAIRRMS